MIVQDYMTKDPVTVRADDPLSRVGEVFDVERFRHLPVVDASRNLVGILSDRDLRNIQCAMEILETSVQGEQHVLVKDVMTATVRSVSAGDSLKSAAELFLSLRVGALPVVEDGKLAGILSYTDVLRAFISLAK
ncbi:MAG TPA: CBS domain-containing protein [Leptospiraceae bacterium]|jgi:acetoin utilization protein AcuB|nr:CBS domain-containing protein [Leptospirales bacterium]HMU82152.1 CBS domain-containing protein [Leptospiraceae bacterium]HMW58928.1 CBS domain-containing protein [Leptospiraceae bacterium]HMX56084.1 CBS domain-containing protein [Leptospiraceae bacterium]HMY46744.1 CBS domain-containing protein [Leptospiraceae bacterium]